MSDATQDPDDLAAAYALGALDPDERGRFEASLAADPLLRAEVASYGEVVAQLALGVTPVRPPAGLRAEVLRRARASSADQPGPAHAAVVPTVAYEKLAWEPGGVPGLRIHWIRRDPGTGESIVLMRGEPGTHYPDHLHTGEEHGFVLQGSFRDALGEYRPGDYIHYPAGSVHRAIEVLRGDVCFFLVITGPIVHLESAAASL